MGRYARPTGSIVMTGVTQKVAPIHREFWEFNQSWLNYVNDTWIPDYSRVQKDKTNSPIITEFIERATKAFQGRGITTRLVKAYISIQEPKDSAAFAIQDGYDDHYPHVHGQSDQTTLIHYLQPGDKPAPLDVFEDGECDRYYLP